MDGGKRGPVPRKLRLTKSERKHLRRMIRRYTLPYRDVLRARIVLALDEDPCVTTGGVHTEY